MLRSVKVLQRSKTSFDSPMGTSVARPEDLVAAHDRLRDFLAKLYPGAVWHREVPVAGKVASPPRLAPSHRLDRPAVGNERGLGRR